MDSQALQKRWEEHGATIFAEIATWRAAHPKATLADIEQEVDEQMNRLRAQLIQESAQASATAAQGSEGGLVCEQCGRRLQARGSARRSWQTHGDQTVELTRSYLSCPQCGGGFFPPG